LLPQLPPPPRIVTADRGDAGQRLDLVLRRHLADVDRATRTRVQAWIENGQVLVNGTPVRRVSARAVLGDVMSVALPDAATRVPMAAEAVALTLLYEDDHLLVIDKPPGIVVHPTYKHMTGTIMNALLWRARLWPAHHRPSIVGRLDKLTSGIVVVAKTATVHAALQREMTTSRCDKDYLAVVYGRVPIARGDIDLRLGRDRSDRRRVLASATVGAPSLTRFERLGRVAAPHAGLSLLRCRLTTGRTHQIRVHLAARGWPIVGDPTYGEPRWTQISDPTLAATLRAFPRQALHAWRLGLTHPITRERVVIEAPVPRDIEELLTAVALNLLFIRRMRTNEHQPLLDNPSLQKDPDDWKTGDEPMTAAQRSYIETLCRDTGETFDENLTKADASKLIDELRQRSPRLSGE
jgi:23S rRNA pseudouridine1911/1915/1917 synthase